jgi:hypothetical protein
MSMVSNIVIPVAVAVVSGAGGSVITAYGTQAKDRREARGLARERLTKAEDAVALTGKLAAGDLALLESSAFTAGIPAYLVEAYKDARQLAERERLELDKAVNAVQSGNDQAAGLLQQARTRRDDADRAASLVSALLLRSLWHPWLAPLTSHHQCRQLRLVLADLDQVSASTKLETRSQRQSFIKQHVRSYRSVRRDQKRKEREAKRLPSGDTHEVGEKGQISAGEGAPG